MGRTLFAKLTISYLLSCQVCHPLPGSSSSSTSRMQDMTPSASQDPDKVRSDLLASGNRSGTDSDRMDKDDRLQLPEWLEGFTENLDDPEIPVHTHNSDSERPTKVVVKLKFRKHSIETHFPKDRNCDVCLRTKITRNPCRRSTGEASIPRAKKVWGLDNSRSQNPHRGR